ncbi:hypothetical protein PRZ48_007970 [Zasmidium cellare]|uniref:Heterokaryon incompatibility domain-containing protein n=1 Tax=Zasmidium cellare TaxID=395010 RepID=A0ABR0EEI8_ZASCE|nr:hypothetical protein PRZ48_007970 [Zasmidium cellare]
MRLINAHTLELEDFTAQAPHYAILSHRWVGRELTYEQYLDPQARTGPSFEKILEFCDIVRTGFKISGRAQRPELFAWVDTCCIDKRSSAEVSEAINSMWEWYSNAEFCVAYLFDVGNSDTSIASSEWFRRGWTLQELLAPRNVIFFNQNWEIITDKWGCYEIICETTGIPPERLLSGNARRASVAQKMSWASGRVTTRREDQAYCLFGLFDVNLPLLYGEGDRAFTRLQKAIVLESDDESIFAWSSPLGNFSGILARSVKDFNESSEVVRCSNEGNRSFRVTSQGIEVETTLLRLPFSTGDEVRLMVLNCATVHEQRARRVLIALRKLDSHRYQRVHARYLEWKDISYDMVDEAVEAGACTPEDAAKILIQDDRLLVSTLGSSQDGKVEGYEMM